MSKNKMYKAVIKVNGEIELTIEAPGLKSAENIAAQVAVNLNVDNRAFSNPRIVDVSESVDFDFDGSDAVEEIGE
jgi:hypothetical protein